MAFQDMGLRTPSERQCLESESKGIEQSLAVRGYNCSECLRMVGVLHDKVLDTAATSSSPVIHITCVRLTSEFTTELLQRRIQSSDPRFFW